MKQFYDVSKKIKDILQSDANINVVTIGSIDKIDLEQQTIGALAHIVPLNVTLNGSTMVMNFTVLVMDIVDFSKSNRKANAEPFYGNDNLQDVWNTQLQVINRLDQRLRRGDAYDDGFEVIGSLTAEPFMDRFANLWAGWATDLSIQVPNNDMCIEL